MNTLNIKQKKNLDPGKSKNERGSALVIAVFVLVLVSVFVALALSRTASEAVAVGNETAEGRTFYAAQGSLEMMTRNFNKVFETKLNPSNTDLNAVRNGVEPGLTPQFSFLREVDKIADRGVNVLPDGPYAGLYATQDTWRLNTTATDQNGVQVKLTRNVLNNRIPIFQFGIFYNDDLEFHPGPRFDFGGRVHSNGSIFMMAQTGLYFSSRVSAVGEIVTDTARNGRDYTNWGENVFIKNGGTDVQLKHDMGSVLKTPANGIPVFNDQANKPKLYNPDMPTLYTNANWSTNEALFGGNLLARQKPLDLPLKISTSGSAAPQDYVELIKRGEDVGDLHNTGGTPTAPTVVPVTAADADPDITASERYYNKTGIRISLADSKAKLPGCASGAGTAAVAGVCGVRLDGASARPAVNNPWAAADGNGSHGYQPLPMTDGYQATRLDGERFRTSAGEVWIKIELVSRDDVNNVFVKNDVTEDILSLGVTEAAPFPSLIQGYGSKDSRSIVKLQRFAIPGVNVTAVDTPYMSYLNVGGTNYNVVKVGERVTLNGATGTTSWTLPAALTDLPVFSDDLNHFQQTPPSTNIGAGKEYRIVPFPIEMFDSREGIYDAAMNTGTIYGTNVPWAGVMSMVDIDVANLKRFLDGEFNTSMPINTDYYTKQTPKHVLRNTDVPQVNGWVIYASDRRGDSDFDGEYDMEDVYGNNDGILQPGENINSNSVLDFNYTNEAVKYTASGLFATTLTPGSFVSPALAASMDHSYYRRGVRLIHGGILPGIYDWSNAANTRGFTVASENGVYVYGNYNARGIVAPGTPTPSGDYLPQGKVVVNGVTTVAGTADGANHIPASIAGDAITILSNNWSDASSFLYPFDAGSNKRKATETFTRFAMLSGDAKSSFEASPNQGGTDPRMGGGVHNFKRFLEDWGSVRLNYAGSLINLYYAHNNNGTFKSSTTVYSPPNRNWVFDSSFLDPARLPPGTPYFQYIQTTGFQRDNN